MTRFRIGAHIGSGGFCTVEEAVAMGPNGVLDDNLARKKLLPAFANDKSALARFRREVRMLGEMDHPHIIPVVGRNLSADPPWFVMPRAESTLAMQLDAGMNQDENWVIASFAAILSGMTYAHSQRRIHRDLKPENVLICGGVLMISDFGLGKRLDVESTNLTRTNIAMGTLPYMAPEQFVDSKRVGPPSDVYALGKILGQMLSGDRPLPGSPRLDGIAPRFCSFIEKCTAVAPGDRYANAADASAAFRLLVIGRDREDSGTGVERLLEQWEALPVGDDEEIVADISDLLVASRGDEEMLWSVFPRLPDQLIEQLLSAHASDFALILDAYNSHIQGALPFEYCDVVANFYRKVFRLTEDGEQRRIMLERLIELGPSHNRWHVGDVVATLLQGMEDSTGIDLAAEIIRARPAQAMWFDDYVRNRTLPPAIARAFEATKPQADDDIPY